MKYPELCIFGTGKKCPLWKLDLEVDGELCQTCEAIKAFMGIKRQTIAQLLITFHDEKKAKELYEKIQKFSSEW